MYYPIAIESGDEAHAWGVIVPDLPGCFSAGDSLEEAIINAREAIAAHLELLIELGNDVPPVSGMGDLVEKDEYRGLTWALVDIDVSRLMGGSEKINVTLPKALIDRIDRCVARHPEYKSRSGFLAQAAIERITKR